jgi:IS4 transposase
MSGPASAASEPRRSPAERRAGAEGGQSRSEAGAIYVMDCGYVDFRRLYTLHQAGALFVTRTKINMNYHRVYLRAVDKRTGLRFDQSIALDGFYTRREYLQHLRRVGFVDPETGKRLIFLTNHFSLPALTIAALYKRRWQVELFFKWVKQNLRIRHFYGTSENAVKTQICSLPSSKRNWRSMLPSTLFYRFCPFIPSRKFRFFRRFSKAIPALLPPH